MLCVCTYMPAITFLSSLCELSSDVSAICSIRDIFYVSVVISVFVPPD